jgi:RND family efflux transporter MFP subunit
MKHDRVIRAASLLVFLLLVMASGCSRNSSPVAAKPDLPVAVQALKVQAEKVQRSIELVGTLEGEREVTVSSEVTGRVVAVHADLGDQVKQGQVLVEVDAREFTLAVERQQAALQQVLSILGLSKETDAMPDPTQTSPVRKAAADLADARTGFERAKALVAKGVSAQQVYDTAEARLKVAEANYTTALEGVGNLIAQVDNLRVQRALARKKLGDTLIHAPFDGAVRARQVEIGQYIKEQGPVMSITTMNPLKLRAGIPEQWFPHVMAGARVELVVEAYRDTFHGHVARVARTIDPQSRTFSIEAEIDNSSQRLRPGLFARAVLTTSRSETVLRVPASAVISYYGIQKVYLIENQKIREQVVKLGDRVGDVIEVVEGLTPGAWIATTELTRIHQGSRVEIREES